MPTLTKRQKEIYEYIKKYINKKGLSPTFEEIKKHFDLSALSGVHQHIDALIKKGFLIKTNNSARGLEIKNTFQDFIKIPLKGTIAAGAPIDIAEEEREVIAVPKTSLPGTGDFYALRVVGDSMIDENINNGDIILVKQQNTADNGQKVVALIDNHEATLKKFYKERDHIRLQPANENIEPIILKKDTPVAIQGIFIDVIRNIEIKNVIIPKKIIGTKKKHKLNNWLNTIQCMDCVEGMKKLPDNSIDLIVTSPPYDEIRKYNGFSYDLHATGKEIFRVLKDGGIAVMVIQDQTKNFAKSLTSFKTIIDWCDNIGFRLFETAIYRKHGTEGAWWTHRFRVDHEYMPIFLKGDRPAYFNKEPLKIPSKHGGKVMTGSGNRKTNGKTTKTVTRAINPMKCRGTIWEYLMAGDKDSLKRKHPAVFPDKIPFDFIQCFCPENGIVLDPFLGCGSTAVTAKKLKRNYIGFDISKEYCDLAKERVKTIQDALL
ncbi:MAG: transcriptional repressor LexA [Patescibacteria group bacterium]|jgi:site-specific DNA-methyltransferase (adenine-specific)